MSYDLVVFNPNSPPSDKAGFMDWYRQQTQWKEGHSYDNPDVCTPELRAWFLEMISRLSRDEWAIFIERRGQFQGH